MLSHDIFDILEPNVQSNARAFPGFLDRAIGEQVWDAGGRRYLDFLTGAGSLNYGHNHPVLKRELLECIGRNSITHSLDLHTQAQRDFLSA